MPSTLREGTLMIRLLFRLVRLRVLLVIRRRDDPRHYARDDPRDDRRDDPRDDRGDVPGWVMVAVMTAGLCTVLYAIARSQLSDLLTAALRDVTGG